DLERHRAERDAALARRPGRAARGAPRRFLQRRSPHDQEERTVTARIEWFADAFRTLADNVETVIRGKRQVIELSLVCMCAEGHLLLEDVPGVGKTSLARAISGSISGSWKRIQFTPDLLPSDVTGVSIFNQKNTD